jgi:ribosomal protein S24E
MDNLLQAVKLYKDNDLLKKLEHDYILTDNAEEKKALKIAIINLKNKEK